MRIILTGSIGRSVTGGQGWANLNYLLGLRSLGHEVFYLEDVGQWSSTYDWDAEEMTNSLDHPANYIAATLEPWGFAGRWAYRAGDETRGLKLAELQAICRDADLLLVRGVPLLDVREEYAAIGHRAFIDVDPGFTQFRLARQEPAYVTTIAMCDRLFTFGIGINASESTVPLAGREWHPTLPPVALEAWPERAPCSTGAYTTVARFRGFKDIEHNGVEYGQRDREIPKFLDLPNCVSAPLTMAITGGGLGMLRQHGWETLDGWRVSRTLDDYQQFIRNSRGEFGVAKHCYVETRSGWFSDRSACYLATGRPTIVQDTGQDAWLPVGKGLVTYSTLEEASESINQVESDYLAHAKASRLIAKQFFDARTILSKLIAQATS